MNFKLLNIRTTISIWNLNNEISMLKSEKLKFPFFPSSLNSNKIAIIFINFFLQHFFFFFTKTKREKYKWKSRQEKLLNVNKPLNYFRGNLYLNERVSTGWGKGMMKMNEWMNELRWWKKINFGYLSNWIYISVFLNIIQVSLVI